MSKTQATNFHSIVFTDSSIPMIYVEGGNFMLNGKIETQLLSFYLGQYLVSQMLWQEIMANNYSFFNDTLLPVRGVSWYDCVLFCNRLSVAMGIEPAYEIDKQRKNPNHLFIRDEKLSRQHYKNWVVKRHKKSDGYRLPTEAEWEYAAGGGMYLNNFVYSGSDELNQVGWNSENCNREVQLQGLKAPNALGIYDMSGNVREWCEDWIGDYPKGTLYDPRGPNLGGARVVRGGGFNYQIGWCKVTERDSLLPWIPGGHHGFRLARSAF